MITKGAVPTKDLITGIRELSRDDLVRLREKRTVPVVQRLRDPHHRLARMVAAGLGLNEAAAAAGYSYGSLHHFMKDPAFQELVAKYRDMVNESFVESVDAYHELATSNMLKAERHIAERIEEKEESGELLSVREALAISRDAADRFGYGKKTTNVNVNVDFAAKLEAAQKRSAHVINAKAALPSPQEAGTLTHPRASVSPLPPSAERLRRRA